MSVRQRWSLSSFLVLLVAAVGVSTACVWQLAAADDETAGQSESAPPVETSDETPDDDAGEGKESGDGNSAAKPANEGLPQPKPRKIEKPAEDLEALLDVEFEKPFRAVRGRKGRFEVQVRVKNVSEEPVEGPVYLKITGSNFEELQVLESEFVAESGDPMFEVIAEERAMSPRARRGRLLKLTFSTTSEKDRERLLAKRDQSGREDAGEDAPEIDWRLTRKGMKLALKPETMTVRKGRGRGTKNRSLPIPNDDPDLVRAQESMEKSIDELIGIDGVEGVAASVDKQGNMVQMIYIKRRSLKNKLPETIGGVPVVTQMTWGFKTYQTGEDPNNRGQGGQPIIENPPACPPVPPCVGGSLQARFDPTIPLGAQINNVNEFSVGTFGFVAEESLPGTRRFLGTNNHVIARENAAALGETVTQNFIGPTNQIGIVARFVNIDFSATGTNSVDAALAEITSTTRDVTFITPCQGYGAMSNRIVQAQVGESVSKCGRTTDCTTGFVQSVTGTTLVAYTAGVARFDNQIIVTDFGTPFGGPGDSGSGVVNGNNDPVGLLFAGGGGQTILNHMDQVIQALNVRLVGLPFGCPTNTAAPTP